jgi:GTPase Era involved in 16S rRNA processing
MSQPILQRMPVATRSAEPRLLAKSPARVVIAGECNSGKTWLANSLLGAQVLPTSFVTRTELPTVVEFGARSRLAMERSDRSRLAITWEELEAGACEGRRLHVRLPSPRLQGMRLIDTPGLGDGDEGMTHRIRRLCGNADLVLWCTPALQAWKASERDFWLSLPARVRDKGVLVLTFGDMLRADQDGGRVLARLQAEAGLHFRRIVLPAQLYDLLAHARLQRMTKTVRNQAIAHSPSAPALLDA